MQPREQYQLDQAQTHFTVCEPQQAAVEILQNLYEQLLQRIRQIENKPWWQFWPSHKLAIQGLYLWGGVGVGKTYLMDLFYESLPCKKKMRLHYQAFMQSIHSALAKLPKQKDPLKQIASDIAEQAYIVCLDEFQVLDITDAMLLTQLLSYLQTEQVILVATSNLPPTEQYQDGLQREAFMPAIALLERCNRVFRLETGRDFRQREAERFANYVYPHDATQARRLHEEFDQLSSRHNLIDKSSIKIQSRSIAVLRQSPHAVWFSFAQICMTPRASQDYFEISQRYRFVFISDIPPLNQDNEDASKRFIQLIDALYEKHCWLALTAAAPLQNLYQGRQHQQTFQRTSSRLQEMQSRLYLTNCL